MEVSNETVDGENEGQKCIFLSDSLFSGVCGFPFYPFVKTIYLSLFLTDKLGQAKSVCRDEKLCGPAHVRIVL